MTILNTSIVSEQISNSDIVIPINKIQQIHKEILYQASISENLMNLVRVKNKVRWESNGSYYACGTSYQNTVHLNSNIGLNRKARHQQSGGGLLESKITAGSVFMSSISIKPAGTSLILLKLSYVIFTNLVYLRILMSPPHAYHTY